MLSPTASTQVETVFALADFEFSSSWVAKKREGGNFNN